MIIRTTAKGTGLVGLFLFFHGKELVAPAGMKELGALGELEVREVRAESDMLGLFYAANSRGVLGASPLRVDGFHRLSTKYSALGNLVLANDRGALVSPLLEDRKAAIEKALGVKAEVTQLAGLDIIGALAIVNNHGAAVHPEISEEERALIRKVLKVDVQGVTLAKSGFLGALGAANDEALVATPQATATELHTVAEALGIQ